MGARLPPARAPKSSAAPSNSTVAPSWDTLAVMPWMASGSTTVRVVSPWRSTAQSRVKG